ncbi:integral membrane protein [Histoplasma capsulatum var. duboisii H88]|uniref:Integral membrane protein n=1 Tax=Ajellomyces capsulatus (strain H88) TaxID=544711 RepID=F0UPD4_AJEC8|nr:integral membrane protein [Histoplasma capsulatum var. duboisii H88]
MCSNPSMPSDWGQNAGSLLVQSQYIGKKPQGSHLAQRSTRDTERSDGVALREAWTETGPDVVKRGVREIRKKTSHCFNDKYQPNGDEKTLIFIIFSDGKISLHPPTRPSNPTAPLRRNYGIRGRSNRGSSDASVGHRVQLQRAGRGITYVESYHAGSLHLLNVNNFLVEDTVYGTMVIYGPAAFLTKASILLILTRVFAPYRKTMSLKKKIRVIGILGAGGLACASSIVRLVLIVQKGNAKDQTYVFMQINLWGNAEVSIGIICACLPSLAALLNRVSNEYMSRNGSRSYDCELAGTDTLTGSSSKIGSQGSFNDAGSDQEILASHAQPDLKVETAIRADEPGTKHSHNHGLHSFTGHGIMKTVDVSHTITTKE